MAISERATLLPTVSIRWAAFSVSSRACSISIRDSAMSARIVPCSAKGSAEGDARLHSPAHRFQGPLGQADQSHAVVNSTRPQPALGNFKTASFAQQHVGRRHAHVFEQHFRVTVRRVVVAEDRQHALDRDRRECPSAPGSSIAAGATAAGVRLAHEDADLAARIAGPGGPPFAAVQHVSCLPGVRCGLGCSWHRTRRPRARSWQSTSGFRRPTAALSQRSFCSGVP